MHFYLFTLLFFSYSLTLNNLEFKPLEQIFTVTKKSEFKFDGQFLTCVSQLRTSVRPSVRLSVCHTLVLCRKGSTYRQTVFTAW